MNADTPTPIHYVSVDLGSARLVAGVFDTSFRLLGQAELSPKPERGQAQALDRVARCVRDAVDECDLDFRAVRAVGLAVPGPVDANAGLALGMPMWGWENVPLRRELEQRLGVPVTLENDCNLAALAIYTLELDPKPRSLAAVCLDRCSAVGWIVQGRFAPVTAGELKVPAALQPDPKNPARHPAKQWRKALQAGDAGAKEAMLGIAVEAGALVTQIIDRLHPDVLALSGATVAELKDWLVPGIRQHLAGSGPECGAHAASLFVSNLGKDAALVGGAVLAAATVRQGSSGWRP
jgi:predicted NBD/HSP70 family sugar kinase